MMAWSCPASAESVLTSFTVITIMFLTPVFVISMNIGPFLLIHLLEITISDPNLLLAFYWCKVCWEGEAFTPTVKQMGFLSKVAYKFEGLRFSEWRVLKV